MLTGVEANANYHVLVTCHISADIIELVDEMWMV